MRTCLVILFDGRAGFFIIIDPERLLSLYSIVFQDVTLFNNTVMENIRMRTVDGVDHIVVLKDGVAWEQGTPQELKATDSIYRHMVETQLVTEQWKYQ